MSEDGEKEDCGGGGGMCTGKNQIKDRGGRQWEKKKNDKSGLPP